MAHTKKYESIILGLLRDYAQIKSPVWPDVENQIIADSKNHRYQLVRIGWDNKKNFIHAVTFHFDIKDGKIWIQANNTDRNIADELMEMGVRQQDIVLGFHAPEIRRQMRFAVA
ncbi:MAG: XisI protein [Saprospiraceae bacterium]